MKKIFFVTMIFVMVSLVQAMDKDKMLTLSSDGINILKIKAGAGYLDLRGDENVHKIEVRAKVVMDGVSGKKADHIYKKYIKLSLEKRRNTAYLESRVEQFPSSIFNLFSGRNNIRIDLEIIIPMNLSVKIEDGSGDIVLKSLKSQVTVNDGSGEIKIQNVSGPLNIDDGSGSVVLNRIIGETVISDGSGAISCKDLTGNVRINDGSGGIELDDVAGNVVIDDSSGEINVNSVDGNIILSDGSGGIHINRVTGDVEIRRAGSGEVSIKNVDGKIIR